MKVLNLTVVMLVMALGIATVTEAKIQKPSRPVAKSTTYEMGKPGQKVTPRYIRESIRSDGSKSYVFGQKINEKGKIIGKHGHSTRNADGTLSYSRTQNGVVVFDDKKGGVQKR